MANRVSLTSAEIEYLLSVVDPAATSPVRAVLARLGVAPGGVPTDTAPTEPPSQDLLDAGLGSLVLRGFVIPADVPTLAPTVAAVAEALRHPQAGVEIGLVAEDAADGALIIDAGPIRLAVAPRAFRCFEVTSLSTETDLATELEMIAQAFLAAHRPGVAVVIAHTWTRDGMPSVSRASAGISVTAEGQWSFAPEGDSDIGVRVPSALDAWRAFSDLVRASTPA